MNPDPQVLIVSTKADIATDEVVSRLTQRGVSYYRLDTEDFPFTRTIEYRPDDDPWLVCDGVYVPVPTTVWYRRFRTPIKPQDIEDGVYNFCLQETRATILGSILDRQARWMSHPSAIWQAEFKPFQLAIAKRLGLTIPHSIITNDPQAIRSAFLRFGKMIVKPARTGYFQTSAGDFAIYTSRVLEEHLTELDSARWSPAIYQELIPKRYNVRVTFVGTQYFAAAIDSQSDPAASIDWRRTTNPSLPHHRIILPDGLADKLQTLMRVLQLSFGAIDLICTPAGEYLFLEVNPSGQWLWLDDMLTLGISDAVTDWLSQS